MTLRLAHAMIQVCDLEGAIAFYQRVLGLSLAERHDYDGASLAYLRAADGGAELELLCERPWRFADRPETGRSHIALTLLPRTLGSGHSEYNAGMWATTWQMASDRHGFSTSTTPKETRSKFSKPWAATQREECEHEASSHQQGRRRLH